MPLAPFRSTRFEAVTGSRWDDTAAEGTIK